MRTTAPPPPAHPLSTQPANDEKEQPPDRARPQGRTIPSAEPAGPAATDADIATPGTRRKTFRETRPTKNTAQDKAGLHPLPGNGSGSGRAVASRRSDRGEGHPPPREAGRPAPGWARSSRLQEAAGGPRPGARPCKARGEEGLQEKDWQGMKLVASPLLVLLLVLAAFAVSFWVFRPLSLPLAPSCRVGAVASSCRPLASFFHPVAVHRVGGVIHRRQGYPQVGGGRGSVRRVIYLLDIS